MHLNQENIWLQRTCLLFQLKYKDTTDTELLFRFIEKLSGSESFWIRKAIGWSQEPYFVRSPPLLNEKVVVTHLQQLILLHALLTKFQYILQRQMLQVPAV